MAANPLPRPRVIGPPPHSPAAEHALTPPHALVEDLKNADRPGIRAELGMPETVIPELLRESAADMAVAGKQGSSAIADLFLDGITWHLLLGAPCDALVVQPDLESTA